MLCSTLFSLGLAEVAVRVMGITDPVLREADPVLGWAPIPNADGWWTREGRGHVHITQYTDFAAWTLLPGHAAEGGLRVALVGDSYVEARQIALEDTIGVRLESRPRVHASTRGGPRVRRLRLRHGVAGVFCSTTRASARTTRTSSCSRAPHGQRHRRQRRRSPHGRRSHSRQWASLS